VDPNDDAERLRVCLETLEAIVEDRGLIAGLDRETRERLVIAAGRVSRPDRAELRKLAKARRRIAKEGKRADDERVLDTTGIRTLRRAPVYLPPALPLERADASDAETGSARDLHTARKCYVCKSPYTAVHAFYDQMCPEDAALNWERRHRSADLSGRVALVTGARVKIGYHAALKLLRAGAHVVVTTRFPHDAAARYAREEDLEGWQHRLDIHGLDLRHTPSVERLCEHLDRSLPRLDFILNNACQTVRRPAGFYRHLMDAEHHGTLPEPARPLVRRYEELRGEREKQHALASSRHPSGLLDPAELSQAELLPEDRGRDLALFPDGQLDADLQQVDRRGRNSWRLLLHEVPTVELLEVQLVNAVAPYVLNGRLRGLMSRSPERDKHIVNVSAMEGQFYRDHKTDKHPHTNMAKAALNMMTRTSAPDFVRDGIHMNSVDTGWITDEDPLEIANKKIEEHGFHPPLDAVDGAARIVDPIFDGMITGEHAWGLFLKDYRPIPW
jgi:NAD(P)-dependent dehydrogenase (short-subunit alcohol dehydrogenase family)